MDAREQSWCRPNMGCHTRVAPFLQYFQLRRRVNIGPVVVWRGPGNIHSFIVDGQFYRPDRLLLKHKLRSPFPKEDNNIGIVCVQAHY